MSMVILPFAPVVLDRGKKNPYILDESLPKARNPQEVMNEQMLKHSLEVAKKKPESERNVFDYLILAKDKIDNIKPPVCYFA